MTTSDPLASYQPCDAVEAADLRRARDLRAAGDPWDRSSALHLTGSAVIVHPPSRRILLRWHRRQGAWLQVGGHGDPGESDPLAVALREGREETGLPDLVPWPDASVVHLVVVPVAPTAHEPAHEHVDVRYVLATAEPDAARPENPDAQLRWLTVPAALAEVGPDNLRETLRRVDRLLG